jgi:iron-sulfur cluster repair protein YtfE (RIC family)
MESIMEELLRQHRDAEAMLVKLAAGVGRVQREGVRGTGVLDDLRDLRREIQGEVLSHFREEEQALFPVLGRHIDSASGPIATMMEEHAIFRQLELQFEEAVAALEAGVGDGWEKKVCDAGDSIARLLPPHIEKEETILFPIAEDLLSAEEWDQVRQLWKDSVAAVLLA